jgi:hypothetical protein
MKKRLLLFAAVLSASANFVFAETKTVQDSNGNTFTYDTQKDLDPSSYEGQTTAPATASITPNSDFYQLTLNSNLTTTIADCNLIYNVKLAEASGNPGAISSFTERLQSSNTVYDVVVSESQIATYIYENGEITGYSVKEDSKDYTRYVDACERAIEINNKLVVRGNEVPRLYDFEEMEVNPKLYYMVTGKKVKNYIPILNVNGEYTRGVVYSNSFVTYNPVGIADGTASYTVDGDGKVGYVHGVVDDGKVEEILSNTNYTYLNYDFTDVSILGSVATDIIDNRIAYFNKNTDVTGQNIVVGTTCESYVIADNGQEIFVNKSFAAEESQYKRTFSPDSYGTIVLPFTVTGTGNIFVKQAKLTGYVPGPDNESSITNKLTFTSTEAIAANTPYLYKTLGTVSGESIFFGDTNGTVKATEEAKSANFNGAQFVGTFEGLSAEEASNVYVVGMVGGVGKIGKTKKALKPGRCYFTYESTNNAKAMENVTIEIIDEDGSVETVDVDKTVTAIDGVVNGEVVSVQYISANGQISNEPFSGINLVKKTFEDGSVETSKVIF